MEVRGRWGICWEIHRRTTDIVSKLNFWCEVLTRRFDEEGYKLKFYKFWTVLVKLFGKLWVDMIKRVERDRDLRLIWVCLSRVHLLTVSSLDEGHVDSLTCYYFTAASDCCRELGWRARRKLNYLRKETLNTIKTGLSGPCNRQPGNLDRSIWFLK